MDSNISVYFVNLLILHLGSLLHIGDKEIIEVPCHMFTNEKNHLSLKVSAWKVRYYDKNERQNRCSHFTYRNLLRTEIPDLHSDYDKYDLIYLGEASPN